MRICHLDMWSLKSYQNLRGREGLNQQRDILCDKGEANSIGCRVTCGGTRGEDGGYMDEDQQVVSNETSVEQQACGIEDKTVANDTGRNALSTGKNISSASAVVSKNVPRVLARLHGFYGGTVNVTVNYHYSS